LLDSEQPPPLPPMPEVGRALVAAVAAPAPMQPRRRRRVAAAAIAFGVVTVAAAAILIILGTTSPTVSPREHVTDIANSASPTTKDIVETAPPAQEVAPVETTPSTQEVVPTTNVTPVERAVAEQVVQPPPPKRTKTSKKPSRVKRIGAKPAKSRPVVRRKKQTAPCTDLSCL
jgi:hypothetical protein